jgi:hypothetical protein
VSSLEQGILLVFRNITVSLALLDLLVLDRLVDLRISFGEELFSLESGDTAGA